MKRLSALFRSQTTPFQILSDLNLHLSDEYATFDIPIRAPNLILAGNIGRLIDYEAYLSFLIRRTQLYEKVFLVLGNHEFYGTTFTNGLLLARQLEQEPRLQGKLLLMWQRRHDIPNTNWTLLGCTLFSQIPPFASPVISSKIPDFREIEDWSISSHNEAHASDLRWLKSEVDKGSKFADVVHGGEPDRQFMVITHFAPSTRDCVEPWQVDMPWSSSFGTEALKGAQWAGVKWWVFGHTGCTVEFKRYGIRVVSNQRKGEEGAEGIRGDHGKDKARAGVFDVEKVIRV